MSSSSSLSPPSKPLPDVPDDHIDTLATRTHHSYSNHVDFEHDSEIQRVNPFYVLSYPQDPSLSLPLQPKNLTDDIDKHQNGVPPVHITKVSASEVEMKPHFPEASSSKSLLGRVGSIFKKGNTDADARFAPSSIVMQGPPPSPPLSDGGLNESVTLSETRGADESHSNILPSASESKLAIATKLTSEPSEISSTVLAPPVPITRRVSGSSTSSRAGSLTLVRSGRLAPQRDNIKTEDKSKELPLIPSIDINNERRGSASSLHSPIPPQRRSNMPSPVLAASPRSPLQVCSTPPPGTINSDNGVLLDSAILAQEDQIRRKRIDRLERRSKKVSVTTSEVESNEPKIEVKSKEKWESKERDNKEEAKVLVGNLIGEDHVNYVLMYNMLTGIRIGVSRCQAKMKRSLTDEEYTARYKFSFDIIGNELTPSAKYDFKFKDYAPWVFRELREEHFHLDPADYLLSLTAKYILSELGSPGKSGSFFYFSRDYRFIIKTISHSEHKFLRSILKDYHIHVKENPQTLLSRFYGLHRVKLPRGPKIHFVIMNNLFPPHRDIHETYDLKGSAFGREYPEDQARKKPRAVLKDKNWVNRRRSLELGPEKRALLAEQLKRDTEFLKRMRVMDYSLLVGIHNMERGNRDNLRKSQLSVFHPEVTTTSAKRKPSTNKNNADASNLRKVIRRADPKTLDVISQLPSEDSADRRHFLFYQDEGGYRATDDANQPMDVIYYLGIIDICTPYDSFKKIEHFWKSMTEDRHTISCVDPKQYGQRFLNFLMSIMRGGNISLRPLGLADPEFSSAGPRISSSEVPAGEVTFGEDFDNSHFTVTQNGRPSQHSIVGHLKTD
nr:1-phosphatidylinositol-4-phosphate 5-kinase [Cryptococcus depauperatus CBS 7841]